MKRRTFLKNIGFSAAALGVTNFENEILGTNLLETRSNYFKDLNKYQPGETGLKIVKIETYLKSEIVCLVKVAADNGLEGWGQISCYDADISEIVLHRRISKHALGQDPGLVAEIADRCIYANLKFPWSYVCRAVSGVETAIWDLLGKLKGKSVCELLGGNPRRFPIYASSMSRQIKPADEAERFVKLRDEKGVGAFKFRIVKEGGKNVDAWPGRTEEIVPVIRKAVGEDIKLLVDANSGLTPDKAIDIANNLLKPNNISHFEEPCPYWEPEWIAEVNAESDVPIAGGEQDNDIAKWRQLVKLKALDILQPDINYIGGISRAAIVADIGREAGLHVVPHSANLTMISLFSLHLLGAIENAGMYMEYCIEDQTWAEGIYYPSLEIDEGKVQIPSDPGWGVSINQEWLKDTKLTKSEFSK